MNQKSKCFALYLAFVMAAVLIKPTYASQLPNFDMLPEQNTARPVASASPAPNNRPVPVPVPAPPAIAAPQYISEARIVSMQGVNLGETGFDLELYVNDTAQEENVYIVYAYTPLKDLRVTPESINYTTNALTSFRDRLNHFETFAASPNRFKTHIHASFPETYYMYAMVYGNTDPENIVRCIVQSNRRFTTPTPTIKPITWPTQAPSSSPTASASASPSPSASISPSPSTSPGASTSPTPSTAPSANTSPSTSPTATAADPDDKIAFALTVKPPVVNITSGGAFAVDYDGLAQLGTAAPAPIEISFGAGYPAALTSPAALTFPFVVTTNAEDVKYRVVTSPGAATPPDDFTDDLSDAVSIVKKEDFDIWFEASLSDGKKYYRVRFVIEPGIVVTVTFDGAPV